MCNDLIRGYQMLLYNYIVIKVAFLFVMKHATRDDRSRWDLWFSIRIGVENCTLCRLISDRFCWSQGPISSHHMLTSSPPYAHVGPCGLARGDSQIYRGRGVGGGRIARAENGQRAKASQRLVELPLVPSGPAATWPPRRREQTTPHHHAVTYLSVPIFRLFLTIIPLSLYTFSTFQRRPLDFRLRK
jgi:hypothetical protein